VVTQAYQSESHLAAPLDSTQGCGSAVRMDLDHLLLAIESIDLQATDAILQLIPQLGLESTIPNRVTFWRIRNTNPYRRNYQRGTLSWQEAKALVLIIGAIARNLNTHLRLLVTTVQQVAENKIDILGLQQNQAYLDAYLDQFRSLYLSRMRSPSTLTTEEIEKLAIHLLTQLLFCGNSLGEQRLWNSLGD
jgi:hypothetical protein